MSIINTWSYRLNSLQQTNSRHNASYIAFLGDKEGVLFLLFVDKNSIPPSYAQKINHNPRYDGEFVCWKVAKYI